MEVALICLHKQLDLQETLEDKTNMLNMFLLSLGENQGVIYVDKEEFVHHIIIHQHLKHHRGAGENERHHQVLEVSKVGVAVFHSSPWWIQTRCFAAVSC